MELFLPTPQPFSLPAVIRSHGWIQLAPFLANDPWQSFSTLTRLPNSNIIAVTVPRRMVE